jgi:hypothetical protein
MFKIDNGRGEWIRLTDDHARAIFTKNDENGFASPAMLCCILGDEVVTTDGVIVWEDKIQCDHFYIS